MATDFTIADVLAWARTKPADKPYDFLDANHCAVAQFGRETGRRYLVKLGDIGRYSEPLRIAVVHKGAPADWTFGNLVTRLEALCPETPISATWTRADAYLADIEQVPA